MDIQTRRINGELWFKFNRKFEEFKYRFGNFLTILLIVLLVIMGLGLGYIIMTYIDLLKTNPCHLCMEQGYQCIKLKLGLS